MISFALLTLFLGAGSGAPIEGDWAAQTMAQLAQSRKCQLAGRGHAVTECTYRFRGLRLLLVMDAADPAANSFTVLSVPVDSPTIRLGFGGHHSCAMIRHYGKRASEAAVVFISPRTGEVVSTWSVPACAK